VPLRRPLIVERLLSRRRAAPAPHDAVEPALQQVPAPTAAPAEAAGTPTDVRRRIPRPPARAAVKPAPRTPVHWNVWSLERVARDHPEAEELEFLVLSLRQFADAAGQLPTDFDALVRESFGDLLVS
jgi:hypothetical protein